MLIALAYIYRFTGIDMITVNTGARVESGGVACALYHVIEVPKTNTVTPEVLEVVRVREWQKLEVESL